MIKISFLIFAFSAYISLVNSQSGLFGQCGGQGWTGQLLYCHWTTPNTEAQFLVYFNYHEI